ncbi:hypothetical protein COLO4_10247 [Corchorus olitorius]|uniref:Uncharacterized protein n=1 Tax=Corchorus olitorius TaxID=93759 RepID=A0A1R3K9E4_9ROSI|nr:hypothetical protein COLO4_10247 [Corchorus olitorius]
MLVVSNYLLLDPVENCLLYPGGLDCPFAALWSNLPLELL